MSVLIERLGAALGGDYDGLQELASGGMGVVFRAHDIALDRLVAIKTIHPGMGTAVAVERFLREARALASFRHPNIVPVHRAGEVDGLPFYVMDYLEGETLAQRIARGALPPAEAMAVADDLLSALAAVHAHDIVHRDIKPANIFLVEGRAVLGDFGISKESASGAPTLTATGHIVGTPAYMPPEQLAGGDVTPRTDVCAAGLVIFETLTGRQWSFDSHADQADWSGVPPALEPAIRRALAWAAADRWRSADDFRRALHGSTLRGRPRAVTLGAGALVVLALGWTLARLLPASRGTGAPVRVQVRRFDAGGNTALGDSVSGALVAALRSAPDVDFRREAQGGRAPDLVVSGRVSPLAAGLRIAVSVSGPDAPALDTSFTGGLAQVADSLAAAVLIKVWARHDRGFSRELPVRALPSSARGLSAWASAEALYARAQWTAADSAYAAAFEIDSTCRLCMLRLSLIRRWLQRDEDTAATRWLIEHRDAFTPQYRQLLDAGMDRDHRLDDLRRLTVESPDFDLGRFVYADELFHRGPLAGRPRAEALTEFRRLVLQRPQFAPAWEHLTWVSVGEGDTATATEALASYRRTADMTDPTSMLLHALLTAAYAWRFQPAIDAQRTTDAILSNPAVGSYAALGVGAQHLVVFDAPRGALWVGERLARWRARPELLAPGLALEVASLMALGRTDSALAAAARLAGASDADAALTAGEFRAALAVADSSDAARAWPEVVAALDPLTREDATSTDLRRRAAWMLALLAAHAGQGQAARGYRALLSGSGDAFTTLLAADSAAAASPARAIAQSQPLLALDSAGQAGDPFFRSLLHLLRARWRLGEHSPNAAANELVWYQNTDFVGRPVTVQAGEVDWAFGTTARWQRARLLDPEPGACRDYADVARLWTGADARYAARADSARRRSAALHCGGAS